jgi:hypothetical protein
MKDEHDLADLENPEFWDAESAELHPGVRNARAVVSVPFAQPEYQRLAAAARERGLSTIQFIREAALAELNAQAPQR